MKTRFTFLLLMLLTLAAWTQTTTITYTYPGTTGVVYSRTETFDWEYGKNVARAPYKLAIEKNGEYLIGNQALTELQKPIWGPMGNQPFAETLPTLTAAVGQFIFVAQYPWYKYPDTIPTTESIYGYELRGTLIPGAIFQNLTLSSLPAWPILGAYEWRPYNPGGSAIFKLPNPMYPIIEQQRAAEMAAYSQVLSETFTQMATYYFPTLPVKNGAIWKIMMPGQSTFVEIPVDNNYWLASTTSATKGFLKPVRPFELKPWSNYTSWSIMSPGERGLKILLGL